jgi:hypothetical protein
VYFGKCNYFGFYTTFIEVNDSTKAEFTRKTHATLLVVDPVLLTLPPPSSLPADESFLVTHDAVLKYTTLSSPGADGLTWQDLSAISNDPTALNTLVDLVTAYSNARLPQLTTQILAGGNGILLNKASGGIRPIVVPSVVHRLTGID